MSTAPHLAALEPRLAALPGTVSVWCSPVGAATATYARAQDATHYAASTMKVAVLVALYRAASAGTIDLDAEVPVVNEFTSAKPGAPRYANDPDQDQDDDVWALLGGTASLRWLARRMIVRSSNFATNIVLAHVGTAAVTEALRLAGVTSMQVERGIEDAAARDAGIDNVVTTRDLAALIGAIAIGATQADGGIAPRPACAEMIDVLLAQERREDLAAGLPAGTRVAFKNGWVTGARHVAGVVFPDDAPPYVIAICTTMPPDPAVDPRELIAEIAAATWADRKALAGALRVR